jgi:hypothetical protein
VARSGKALYVYILLQYAFVDSNVAIIITIYIETNYFTQYRLIVKNCGYQFFNVNCTCKVWDIIVILTWSVDSSKSSQEIVLDDGTK